MALKVLFFFALAVVGVYSQAVTEVQLQDQTTTHISSPLHAKSISIGILFLDKLVSCQVIFPSGLIYELYPNAQTLPHASMINGANGGSSMFPSCGMSFSNAPPILSGTYEVLSLVDHTIDPGRTLSKKKFHITFEMTEVEFPFNNLVQAKEQVKNA